MEGGLMSEILLEVSRTQYASMVIDNHVIESLMDMTLRDFIEERLEGAFESEDVEARVIE